MKGPDFPEHKEIAVSKEPSNYLPQIETPKKTSRKFGIMFILLILLVLGLGGYVSYDLYVEYRLDRDNIVVDYVVNEIAKLAVQCEEIPLIVGSETINLIAIDCLNFGDQNG